MSPDDSLVADFCSTIKELKLLKSYAEALGSSLHQYEYLVHTQATADRTGYRELRDWAKDMLRRFESLINILVSISTVGAGLVYATIFSASRGNVELMALTFPLFTIGFLVPITVHIGLKWSSGFPNPVQFASQTFWKLVINAFMVFASVSVTTALVVLNVTVFILDSDSSASDCACPPSKASANLVSISGITAFALSGSAFLVLLSACTLAIASKSIKTKRPWITKKTNALEHFKHV